MNKLDLVAKIAQYNGKKIYFVVTDIVPYENE